MGVHSSRAALTKCDLDELAKITGLSRTEIERFYLDYVKASGRDGVMDKNEFIQLYSSLPIARSQDKSHIKDQAIRIFRALDCDHNGVLSFNEFLSAIIMMNYQMSENNLIDSFIQENNTSGHEQNDKQISMQYAHQIF
jgi:Ca2+-binding EF-hand superfamily protein